ncbi:hypothetical protein DEO72_LG4g1736 [Vigna unguiculata]|uniref:Uncharacterized protein n=1 Tax=Vigna unguiculata TaxID=3917 RepID=A0A4D6LRR4_VIGUN|nr:hypothetical protein DEO72_LG4g1736 [Vigna unguiculata]
MRCLAQARVTRPSEFSKKTWCTLLASSSKRGVLFLGERRSRPGEGQQRATVPGLAQAGRPSLSEMVAATQARTVQICVLIPVYLGWLFTSNIAWEFNVEKIIGGCIMRNMKLLCDRRNSMSLVGRPHGVGADGNTSGVAGADILAQASSSRLGENSRNSSRRSRPGEGQQRATVPGLAQAGRPSLSEMVAATQARTVQICVLIPVYLGWLFTSNMYDFGVIA